MRKFYFENSIGERIDLNTSPYFFINPQGLGFANAHAVNVIENGFYKNAYTEYQRANIVGELVVMGNTKEAYENYRTLVNWLNKGYGLYLIYSPFGTLKYYTDINIDYLQKSEYTMMRYLSCAVSMTTKSPWYIPTPTVLNIEPEATGEVTTYDCAYDCTYLSDSVSGAIQVQARGHIPSAIKITAQGALTNPTITLTSATGVVIGKMALTGSVDSEDEFLYQSLYLDSGVWINGVDQIANVDLSNNNFFRIPIGQTCTLTISTSDSVQTITAAIFIYDYYRSV